MRLPQGHPADRPRLAAARRPELLSVAEVEAARAAHLASRVGNCRPRASAGCRAVCFPAGDRPARRRSPGRRVLAICSFSIHAAPASIADLHGLHGRVPGAAGTYPGYGGMVEGIWLSAADALRPLGRWLWFFQLLAGLIPLAAPIAMELSLVRRLSWPGGASSIGLSASW